MRRTALTLIALSTLLVLPEMSAAQVVPPVDARARAQATLPPDVFENVSTLADQLALEGIPSDPLFNKALEGMVKRIPPDRMLVGIRTYGDRLGQARNALGPQAELALLIAGADALTSGVTADALRSLPRDRPRSPVALLVLKELVESGVPTDQALQILRAAIDLRAQDQQMINLSRRVRGLIRDGVPPREAVDRVRNALNRNRGGLGVPIPPGSTPTDRLINRRRGGLSDVNG